MGIRRLEACLISEKTNVEQLEKSLKQVNALLALLHTSSRTYIQGSQDITARLGALVQDAANALGTYPSVRAEIKLLSSSFDCQKN